MKRLFAVSLPLLLSSCLMNAVPNGAYVDPGLPNSATTVFSAYDDHGPAALTVGIRSIDGVPFRCRAGSKPGCSFWVRLAPGKHTFTLGYDLMNGGLRSYQEARDVVVEINMLPRTMYVARVTIDGNFISVRPEPIAPNATYVFPAMHKGSIDNLFD